MTELAVVAAPMDTPVLAKGKAVMVIAPWVQSHTGYGKYFANAERDEGTMVILDNGAFEEGAPLPPKALLGVANIIKATHVILPDTIGDAKHTLYNSWDALYVLDGHVKDVIFVPQGHEADDYIDCLNMWLTQWEKERASDAFNLTIGISQKRPFHKGGCVCQRHEYLIRMLAEHPTDMPFIHFLGLPDVNNFVNVELGIMKDHPDIALSIDTSWPVALAQAGLLISPTAPKVTLSPRGQLVAEKLRLARVNILTLRKWLVDGEASTGVPYHFMRRIGTDGGNVIHSNIRGLFQALGMQPGYYYHEVQKDTYEYAGSASPGFRVGYEVVPYVV